MAHLHEIMTSEIKTVGPRTPCASSPSFFVAEGVSGAPVVSRGKVMDVVPATDLLEFDAESRAVAERGLG